MTSKTERQRRLKTFVQVFNLAYPRWEINGDATAQLTPKDVDYRSLSTYIGRCGPRSNGRVYFGLKHSWWSNQSPEDRLGLLIHELAHVKHTNHRAGFWEHVVRLHNRLQDHSGAVATALHTDNINWEGVTEWLVTDPKTSTVDNRTETAYERRLALATALDYPTTEIEPFDGITIYWKQAHPATYETLPVSELNYTARTLEEITEWFTSPRKRGDGVTLRDGRFIIDYPVARELRNGFYEIVEGDRRVDFFRYSRGTDTVKVAVRQDE